MFSPSHPRYHPLGPPPRPLRAAIGFWEKGRIGYNAALTLVCLAYAWRTWPAFRPAVVLPHLRELLGLALLANLAYSGAYLAELTFHLSPSWRRWRWIVLAAGILFGMLLTQYWVGDEIYPSVMVPGR